MVAAFVCKQIFVFYAGKIPHNTLARLTDADQSKNVKTDLKNIEDVQLKSQGTLSY